jgi:predicted ATP-dependent endonuclease of OLD family
MPTRSVILVEGDSDRGALEAVARKLGRDLAAGSVQVLPMGGATNIGRFLDRFGPRGADLELSGLYDVGEEPAWIRAFERAGFGSGLDRSAMERLGSFACVEDLEDELIRALGVAAVEGVLEAQGELGVFRTFQRQPQWRERRSEEQLRRFLGTFSGRKIRSAPALVDALQPDRVPRPLLRVLAHALADGAGP